MNVKATLLFCAKELKNRAKADISSTVRINGETLKCFVAAQKIEEMAEMVYTKLDTSSIRMVTLCKDCAHYKRFRSKKSPKKVTYLCELDKTTRDPDFYCKNGLERFD